MTYLPWTLFGRRIHPFSFALFVATTSVAVWLTVFQQDVGGVVFRDPLITFHAGIVAWIASLCLFGSFLFNKDKWMRAGLIIATFVFMTRSALFWIVEGWHSLPAWISLSLAVGSGGAWLLERADSER